MKAIAASLLAAAVGGAVLCPLCGSDVAVASAASVRAAQAVQVLPPTDTATVRMHISGMTCGTCPVTARKALEKLAGVYSATVTLPDSLGVVKFDVRRVKPEDIAAHLTRMTGYGARVLPEIAKVHKP